MLYNHFLTRPLEILLFLFLFVRSSGQFGLVSVQRANKPTTWAIEAFLCIKIDNLINCVGSDLRSTMDRLLWGRFVGLTMMKNASLIYNQHFPLVSKLWVQSRSNPLNPNQRNHKCYSEILCGSVRLDNIKKSTYFVVGSKQCVVWSKLFQYN